mmetsp:Transcript_15808/g.23647  ORF Transcript_15808/g.23647 Transcript_15808/m.23647 type:complete len:140 (-) Transcript_15808:48-467(-)
MLFRLHFIVVIFVHFQLYSPSSRQDYLSIDNSLGKFPFHVPVYHHQWPIKSAIINWTIKYRRVYVKVFKQSNHKKTHERYDHRSKWVDGQGSAKRFDELTKEVVVAPYRRRCIVPIIGVAAFLCCRCNHYPSTIPPQSY